MVVALLQVRMMKWCTFGYSSKVQTAVQTEYNVFLFLFSWMCLGLCSEIKFPLGENKVCTLSCAQIYQADGKPNVKLWGQKWDGELPSRLAAEVEIQLSACLLRRDSF